MIQRLFYFVTINGENIVEDSGNILKPNIGDFNTVMNKFIRVSKIFRFLTNL